MRKLHFQAFMLLLASIIISISCSSKDNKEPDPALASDIVGTWVEETGDQYGFTFVFRENMTCDMIYRDKGATGGVHTSYDIENGAYVVQGNLVKISDGGDLFLTIISMTAGRTMRCQWRVDRWSPDRIEGPYTFIKQ